MKAREVILAAVGAVAVTVSARASEQITQDFGVDPFNKRYLKLVNRSSGEAVAQKNGTLLITLPFGKAKLATQAGFRTRFHLQGDFEITLRYRLMLVEKPKRGYGAGVVIRLPKGNNSKDFAGFAHRRRRDGKYVFSVIQRTFDQEPPKDERKSFVTLADHGQLRIVRTGPTLHYLVAEGDSSEFRELHNLEFGDDLIEFAQITGDTGGAHQGLTIRLVSLSIQADELPVGITDEQSRSIWGLWFTFAITGGLVLIGVWFWRRRRQMESIT